MREIPRKPPLPNLNDELVENITSLCFQKKSVMPSDALFVFGTWQQKEKLIENIKEALNINIAPLVFINGGIPSFERKGLDHKSIAERVMENIDINNYPNTQFIVEKTAIHTLEEVQKTIKLYDFSKLKTISYIAKAHAATRQMLTLKKYVPQVEYRTLPYAVSYPDESNASVTRDNWMDNELSMYRVWGQFLRIKKYGERGDIAYPDNIKEQVDYIIDKTGYVFG